MPTRIRLQRKGRKKRAFYHIVVADSRAPRDGRFIERLGAYNPVTTPATIEVDVDKALHWLQTGAEPTKTVEAILSYTGVLYKKHLQRGVAKGAFSQEEADIKFADFVKARRDKELAKQRKIEETLAREEEAKTAAIREKLAAENAKKAAKEAEEAEDAAAEAADSAAAEGGEEAAPAAEAVTEAPAEASAEEAPAEEASAAEAPAEEAPAAEETPAKEESKSE